jgi:cytochrome c oxidase subunit 1
MIIAIPTGVKIFNWLGTMWGGSIRFSTAMLWAVGSIAIFTIGGLTGIMHSSAPIDLQQHDTYFVVGHFHYVVGGGALLGLIAGIYYWYPKVTGRYLSETLGKWHFWTGFVGFNLTFFPMHFAGLYGMPRRVFTYSAELGVDGFNLATTIGGFVFAISTLLFVWNLVRSATRGKPAPANAWNAPSLEWATASPPPHYNFAQVPQVRSREPLWDHPELARAISEARPAVEPHMPSPSYWPLITAFGVTMTWALVMTEVWWAPVLGFLFTMLSAFRWAFEPPFRARAVH